MRRNPRVFHELFHIVNGNTVIVPEMEAHQLLGAARRVELDLAVAHGAGPDLEECQLSIVLGDDTLRMSLPRLRAPAVLDLGRVSLPVPHLSQPALRRISLSNCVLPMGKCGRKITSTSPFTRNARRQRRPGKLCGRRTRTFASV